VLIDVNGVGYDVLIPLSYYDKLPAPGEEVKLLTHLNISERDHVLFGFATSEERDLFKLLMDRVSGIGPKLALAVLSGTSVNDFKDNVIRGDVAALSRISGVGKKTAERIVLELKDKLLAPPPTHPQAPVSAAPPSTAKGELLQGALTRMGFRPAAVERAIATLGPRVETAPLSDLIRDALALLR